MDKLQREVLLAALDYYDERSEHFGNDIRLFGAIREYLRLPIYLVEQSVEASAIDAMRAKLTENPNA